MLHRTNYDRIFMEHNSTGDATTQQPFGREILVEIENRLLTNCYSWFDQLWIFSGRHTMYMENYFGVLKLLYIKIRQKLLKL